MIRIHLSDHRILETEMSREEFRELYTWAMRSQRLMPVTSAKSGAVVDVNPCRFDSVEDVVELGEDGRPIEGG